MALLGDNEWLANALRELGCPESVCSEPDLWNRPLADLGIDSLALAELLFAVEDEFDAVCVESVGSVESLKDVVKREY